MSETKFREWLINNKPSDSMIYSNAFWETYNFWEHMILPLFTDAYYADSIATYNKVNDEINKNIDIVGIHRSKSIVHPVIKITYKGVEIIFRYNFYNYEVVVISPNPIKLPKKNLFSSKRASFFYEGFPSEYKIEERYEDNKCKFAAHINDHYRFYTFMFLLERKISKWDGEGNYGK